MIPLLLWAPYALLALILVISFLLVGRKRGILRALISMITTLALGTLALLLAKVLAAPLSNLASAWLAPLWENLMSDLPASIAEMIQNGLTEMALAVVLYGILLLLLESIGKPVIAHLTGKITEKKPCGKGSIAVGLLISLADALLLAYLFVMPLYGTLSLGAKTVTTVAVLNEETVPEAVFTVAKEADRHPMTRVARLKPCAFAYDTLTTFRLKNEKISLSRTADRVLDVVKGLAALKEGNSSTDDQLKLIDTLEALIGEAPDEMIGTLADLLGDQKEISFLTDFLKEVSANGTLKENVRPLADLARAAAKKGLLNAKTADENVLLNALSDRELLGQFTRSMSATPELTTLKTEMMQSAFSSADTDVPAVKKLMEQMASKPVTDTEREADALYQIISAAQKAQQPGRTGETTLVLAAEMLEGLARHPNLGPDAVMDAAKELLGGEDAPEAIKSDEFMDILKKRLIESVNKPVGEGTLAAFVKSAIKTGEAVTKLADQQAGSEMEAAEAFSSLITADKEVVKDMSKVMSESLLVSSGMSEETAGKMNALLKDALETAAETETTKEQAAQEGEKMAYVFATVNKFGDGSSAGEAMEDKQKFIDSIVTSQVLSDTVEKQVVATNGTLASDPSGLFAEMTAKEKQELKNELDTYRGTHTVTEEQQKTLDQLAAFMGLQ